MSVESIKKVKKKFKKPIPLLKVVLLRSLMSSGKDSPMTIGSPAGGSPRSITLSNDIQMSSLSPVSSPSVSVCSEQNRNQDVSRWSVSDVVNYFEATDCSQMATLFCEHEVNGKALLLLSLDSLIKFLGIKLGPALMVMTHIEKLKSGSF